eukprot:14908881-Alexandrium_andersonii.AAC.1
MPERARALQVAAAARVAPYVHDDLAGVGWTGEQIRGTRTRNEAMEALAALQAVGAEAEQVEAARWAIT